MIILLIIVCLNFVKIMDAHTCILTWPKTEKQKTVFHLLSAVAQKKMSYREEECFLVNLRKRKGRGVEREQERNPKLHNFSLFIGTLLSKSLKNICEL